MGIWAAGNNWLVQGNEVKQLFQWQQSRNKDADYARFFGNNITFRNNYFHGTRMQDVNAFEESHVDCFQTWHSNGVEAEYAHSVLFEKNICFDFSEGIQARDAETEGKPVQTSNHLTDFTVRNNVFANGFVDIPIYKGGWGLNIHSVKNLKVVNNFFKGVYAVVINKDATGIVKNNIFYGDGIHSGIRTDDNTPSTVDFGYNLNYNVPDKGYYYRAATDLWDTNPLVFDPVNLVGADALPFTSDDGYKLQNGSPAINAGADLAGIVVDDILGNSRPQGGKWDIGVFESSSIILPPRTCFDLTSDSKVDLFDLVFVALRIGNAASDPADVKDNDGVNIQDLQAVAGKFGQTC